MEYQRHSMSEIFPLMKEGEMKALVDSMKTNGYDKAFPIILYDGQIVDGWHRYEAAKQADVKPVFSDWGGTKDKLIDFVVYANSVRRHLSAAAHAQALVKADILRGGKRMTQAEIASLAHVSRATVAEQERIRELAPEIADGVAEGEIKVSQARRQVLGREDTSDLDGSALNGQATHLLINAKLAREVNRLRFGLDETFKAFVYMAIKERVAKLQSAAAA